MVVCDSDYEIKKSSETRTMDVKPTLSFVNASQFYLIDVLVLPMKPNVKNIVRKKGKGKPGEGAKEMPQNEGPRLKHFHLLEFLNLKLSVNRRSMFFWPKSLSKTRK